VTPTPTADDVTAHTLLNCLVREVSGPEGQTSAGDGRLLVHLPRRDLLLRVALRRAVLAGPQRFAGPVSVLRSGTWSPFSWHDLALAVRDELTLRTGVDNDEFVGQVEASHAAVDAVLRYPRPTYPGRLGPYLVSEQSLVFGHRHHPTPKAGPGASPEWLRHAPETGARFPLRLLAVRSDAVRDSTGDGDYGLPGEVPPGYLPLPAHPWQLRLLAGDPALRACLADGRLLDLGTAGPDVVPTSSVRTVYHPGMDAFLKFSLGVRITNCIRTNASYELSGAVALTRLLAPVAADLAARFPGVTLLREPFSRTVEGPLVEGLGVIVREGLGGHLRPGVTPLLAGALADEHSGLLASLVRDPVAWFDAYVRLLVPPVLHAYFQHGVVLEPHLQNVVVGVGPDGVPAQVFLRDLEGVKLVESAHRATLSGLPPQVAYDAERGWNRVVYCLLVNHLGELLAAVADLRPSVERTLWSLVRARLDDHRHTYGDSPQLRALLSGVPLPGKANLLTRWQRHADRLADYVPVPNPWGAPSLTALVPDVGPPDVARSLTALVPEAGPSEVALSEAALSEAAVPGAAR
jgi:siderophore synthetase component